MEFRELKYITKIAEYGSFTQAANALYVSQPSLSHMVARVEERLGAALFDRSQSPLRLTYAGEVYLRYASEILSSGELMEREFRDIAHKKKGRLRVGFPYERAAYMLPEIIPRFKAEYPNVELEIKDAGGEALLDMIERGRIDFCILPMFASIPGFDSQLIYEEPLLLSAAPGMLLPEDLEDGDETAVSIPRLADKPFIRQTGGHVIHAAIEVLFKAHHIRPRTVMEISGNMAAYRLSCAGVGLAIIPELTTRMVRPSAEGRLYRLAGKVPVTWETHAIYRKNTYIGEVESRFFQIARELFRDGKG